MKISITVLSADFQGGIRGRRPLFKVLLILGGSVPTFFSIDLAFAGFAYITPTKLNR